MDSRPGRSLVVVVMVLSGLRVSSLAKILHHFVEATQYGFNARVVMVDVIRAVSDASTMYEAMRAGELLYISLLGVRVVVITGST